jgi:aminoglycoside phosphotransferase
MSCRAASDPVQDVIRALAESRQVRLSRRFRHGAGGTSLLVLEEQQVVLKAWPTDSPTARNLDVASAHMTTMRERGVPIPDVVERGRLADCDYLVYQYLPGRWPRTVSGQVMSELIEVVDAEVGAAGVVGRHDWHAALGTMLNQGDALFDIDPATVAAHEAGARLLDEAHRRLALVDAADVPGADVLHGDFAPENALVHNGHLSGIVDWERCRTGDARLDLVGVLYDVEIGGKATATVRRRLHQALRDRMTTRVLDLYTAVYAVRYASWAIGTSMEGEVLALGLRLLDFSRAG